MSKVVKTRSEKVLRDRTRRAKTCRKHKHCLKILMLETQTKYIPQVKNSSNREVWQAKQLGKRKCEK